MARATKKSKDSSETKEAVASKNRGSAGAVIYVGPPIKGTLLNSTFTIFADGVPKEYAAHPSLKHLFVQPERLDQARREIGRAGSLRNTYYKRVAEEFREKGGK